MELWKKMLTTEHFVPSIYHLFCLLFPSLEQDAGRKSYVHTRLYKIEMMLKWFFGANIDANKMQAESIYEMGKI